MTSVPMHTLNRIVLAAIMATLALSGYGLFRHGAAAMDKIQRDRDILTTSLKGLSGTEADLAELNRAIRETAESIQALNDRIPESARIGEFLGQLDTIFKKRNITLEAFQPLPVVPEEMYTRIPIQLISRGTFSNIYRFLLDVESMNRLVDVEQLAIKNPAGVPEGLFEFKATIFERGSKGDRLS